ncbi:hypothetical protein VE02_03625 [Pseudogymnoascus sp. 03VT05]|nr:hypothetical protein VE02_03625 [Pseudogymnoascus sp. 03VT05]
MSSTDTSLDRPDQSQIHQGQSLIRNSSAYRINLSQDLTQSHLELTKVSNDAKTRQHLVSFPNSWTDLDNSIDITLSKAIDADRNVRMMINQGHKSWYDASEPQQPHFPIIVDKDSRAFLPAQSQRFDRRRKRDAAEMLEFDAIFSEDGDDLNASKQRLIDYGGNAPKD